MTAVCSLRLPSKVSSIFAAALAVVSCLSLPAHAASIVTDGGFESAGGGNTYFAGQSIDNGSWTVTRGAVYLDSQDPYVYAGSNSLNLTLANLFVPNTLSQVVSTVVGQTYGVNFFADADIANTFSLTENGILVAGAPTSIATNGFPNATNSALFTSYSGSFLATSAATTLNLTSTATFGIGSQGDSVIVDNVSVQSTVTPEPGSITLVLTGLAGVGEMVRRKRFARDGVGR